MPARSKLLVVVLVCAGLLALFPSPGSAAPANDNFSAAEAVTGRSGTVTGSNIGATKEIGEPSHAGDLGGASVWYSWAPPRDATVTVDTSGSEFDTLLAIYTGSSFESLAEVASNNNCNGAADSCVTFSAVATDVYRIAVDGYDGTLGMAASGSVVLNWSLAPVADLSISKTDAPDPVTVGDNVNYRLVVTNAGPDTAGDVRVTDTLPAGVTFLSVTPSDQCGYDSSGTVTCDVGEISSSGTATVTVMVNTTAAGTIANTAAVSSASQDPNTANNSDSEQTSVQPSVGTVSVAVADYSYTPTTATTQQGYSVQWKFNGPHEHTATDSSGMGLFDSGAMAAGSFYSFQFLAAGSYPYRSTAPGDPSTMTGKVSVPIKVAPPSGGSTTTFTVTWSGGTVPAGYVFDVQIKRPGSTSFVGWKTGQRQALSSSFTPDAGAGTYSFRARLRRPAAAKASGWSPTRSIGVAAQQRPNMVLIVTDDQRWDTLWAMPTVQSRLVSQGVEFTSAFVVNPLCCPSRASILTGQYSHSTGVYLNEGPVGGFSAFKDSSTIATWLHDSGYRTGLFGKYMNQYYKENASYIPPGWDRWFAMTHQGGYYNYSVSDQGVLKYYKSRPTDYSTDVLAAKAASFIRDTSKDQSLFLYFTPKAPHKNATPAARHADAFSDLEPLRPPSYNEADVSGKPAWVQGKPPLTSTDEQNIDALRRNQYRTLLAVDDAIGTILDALKETGRLSNSLIILTSDNGYLLGEHRLTEKGAPYEESIRVPYVVRYDALITAPRTDNHLVLNIDLAPTLAEAAQVSSPGAEGQSFLHMLASPTAQWRTDFLLDHLGGGVPTYCGVRNQRYVYTAYDGEAELYDLVSDPHQLHNRAGDPALESTESELRNRLRQLCNPPPPGFTPP